MLRYAVVEIAGRQYKVAPDQEIIVDNLGDVKTLECDKVLMLTDEKSVNIGTPYLKDKLVFDVLATVRQPKIRVAKYHAKANTRRVRGSRRVVTHIKLQKGK